MTILFGINTIAPVLLPNLLGMIAYAVLIPLLIITMGLLTMITISVTQRLQQGAETAP